MAALLPSMRTRFSNAGDRLAISAGGVAAGTWMASATAGGCLASSRSAPRSSSSPSSLRSSPSAVKGRRSITRNESSCLGSDKGHSLTIDFDPILSRVAGRSRLRRARAWKGFSAVDWLIHRRDFSIELGLDGTDERFGNVPTLPGFTQLPDVAGRTASLFLLTPIHDGAPRGSFVPLVKGAAPP